VEILALLVAIALPWIFGVALIAALHGRERFDAPGSIAWTCGAGWFAGALVVTLWLRALSLLHVKFALLPAALPIAGATLALAAIAWRRHRGAGLAAARGALGTLFAVDRAGWRRAAWLGLLLWIALHLVLLLLEVWWRPMFPWDAWTQWATKARVWFAQGSLVPFVDSAAWLAAGGAYTDSAPGLPATVPLLQVWTATLLGRWDDSLVNLPWWICGVALAFATYGFLAGRRLPALVALIGTWLIVSLPILDVHIALAGYADIWLGAYLALAVQAFLRALDKRDPSDVALAALFLAAVPLIKPAGMIWVAVLVPGFLAAAFPAWGRRIGVACLVAAAAAVMIGTRTGLLTAGGVYGDGFEPRVRWIAEAWYVFGNWNLLWVGAIAAALLGRRHLLSARLAPLTLIVAGGLAFLLFAYLFPGMWLMQADQTSINRSTLHIAPLVAIWIVLLYCEWSGTRRESVHRASPTTTPSSSETVIPPQSDAVGPATDADPIVREALQRHQRGDLDGAEEKYRAALEIAPAHVHATHYLGVVLYQRRRLDDAIPLLERSAAAVPTEPEFQNNLGLALAAADRNDEAIAAYRNTLQLAPDHALAWNNLGLALFAACRVQDAIAAYRQALAQQPNFGEAHWNLALALLANGEYAEGWGEYEWRLRINALGGKLHETPGLLWDGALRRGLSLLVAAEQGMGDALQFIRYVQPLALQGIRVILRAPTPLARLLATAPGVAAVVPADQRLPAYDAHASLMSLPRLLGAAASAKRAAVPYLRADPALRGHAAAALAPFAGSLKVGLAWSGNPLNSNDHRRSIPLARLSPLLTLPGTAWFSLQRPADERDVDIVPAATMLRRLPLRDEFDGAAALMEELDVIVSVDTSLAHLAGALGRPMLVLLAFAPDWRWHPLESRSIWYPTARLFRQTAPGDWDSVVATVADELRALMRARTA
jgi:tetratricopeptide (TPR) repeat protein